MERNYDIARLIQTGMLLNDNEEYMELILSKEYDHALCIDRFASLCIRIYDEWRNVCTIVGRNHPYAYLFQTWLEEDRENVKRIIEEFYK